MSIETLWAPWRLAYVQGHDKGAPREETGAALARRLAVLTVSPKMLPTDAVSAANNGHVVCSEPRAPALSKD